MILDSIVLVAITSTFIGLFIAVSVRQGFEAQTFSNFLRFPMLFFCWLFIPLTDLPVFLRPVSYALPLTHGADILKTAINQNGIISIPLSFIALLGFSVFLFAYSIYNVNYKWIL